MLFVLLLMSLYIVINYQVSAFLLAVHVETHSRPLLRKISSNFTSLCGRHVYVCFYIPHCVPVIVITTVILTGDMRPVPNAHPCHITAFLLRKQMCQFHRGRYCLVQHDIVNDVTNQLASISTY